MTATTTTASKEQVNQAQQEQHPAAAATAKEGLPGSPISVTNANPAEPWKISKWSSLQEKRLKLSKQRVALERRLFESAPQFNPPPTQPEKSSQERWILASKIARVASASNLGSVRSTGSSAILRFSSSSITCAGRSPRRSCPAAR